MRAIVVRLDNDGDVLLAGPAIRAVAAGSGHVALLCGPRGAAAAALLPGVDDVLVRRAEWIDPEPTRIRRTDVDAYVEEIAGLRADAAVVLTSFHQSPLPIALLLRLAGVPRIAAISEDYPGSLLDVRLPDPGDVHETQRALGVAEALGFTLPAGDDGRLAVRAAEPPTDLPDDYVVIHPGASVPARAWAPERQRELAAALASAGRCVVVTGAPSERALTTYVAGDHAIDLGGATSLGQLAGVLAAADATIVGNTGPAHLSAAVGTPVVSLFAPTVPAARWHPWGVPHRVLFIDVPCAGCRARSCPVDGHPCLSGVTVDDVLRALERLPIGVAA
jgi:ADP-heptose:LPS heptosyltransferase